MPAYGKYYNNQGITSRKLQNVALPEKIRCERCNKYKGHSNFAKKRLNELREKISDNKGPFSSQCTLCVPRQIMELKCFSCGKDKGLEDFAKAQRKDPDHAKCNQCMSEQLKTEPIEGRRTYHGVVVKNYDSEDGDSSDDDDDDDDNDDNEYKDFSSVASTYPESVAGTTTGNLIGEFDDVSVNDTASTTSGVWTPIRNRSTAGVSVPNTVPVCDTGRSASSAASVSSTWSTGKSGNSSSGFNPMEYGHPRAASVADSMETNRPASSSGSKWAKVPAYKPESKQEPEVEVEEENHWGGDEEEEESSSDDDDSEDEYTTMKSRCR